MKIINLTPHLIRLRSEDSNEAVQLETDLVCKSQGRAFITTRKETALEGLDFFRGSPFMRHIPEVEIEYGPISDLPQPQEDTIFIVSMPTAQFLAAQGRTADIRYPDTGKPEFCIRDAQGQPFATRRLLKAKIG